MDRCAIFNEGAYLGNCEPCPMGLKSERRTLIFPMYRTSIVTLSYK